MTNNYDNAQFKNALAFIVYSINEIGKTTNDLYFLDAESLSEFCEINNFNNYAYYAALEQVSMIAHNPILRARF